MLFCIELEESFLSPYLRPSSRSNFPFKMVRSSSSSSSGGGQSILRWTDHHSDPDPSSMVKVPVPLRNHHPQLISPTNNYYQTIAPASEAFPQTIIPYSSYRRRPTSSRRTRPTQNPSANGWGWSKTDCTPFRGEVPQVSRPQDLPPNWIIQNDQNITVDPATALPGIDPIPATPSTIRIGMGVSMPPGFKVTFNEQLQFFLSDRTTQRGYPYSRNREVHSTTTGKEPIADYQSTSSRRRTRPLKRTEEEEQSPSSGENVDTIRVTTMVHQSPNISAPINGTDNERNLFLAGIRRSEESRLSKPVIYDFLEDQFQTLGTLFADIRESETKYAMQMERQMNAADAVYKTPGWTKDTMTKDTTMETPIVIAQVTQWSLPEADSSERTILDSVYSFGLPAFRRRYGQRSTRKGILEGWESMRKQRDSKDKNSRGRLPLEDFSGLEDAGQELNQRVRDYLQLYREFARDSFEEAEERAAEAFRTYQFNLIPTGVCPFSLDPAHQGANTGASVMFGSAMMDRRRPRRP
jgi:hypothetical protein